MRIRERILETVIGVAIGLLLSYLCHKPSVKVQEIEKVVKDTVTVIKADTITHIEPRPYKVEVRDSIIIKVKDTIYLTLPRVVREYHDSDYHVKVSGVDPKLDYIRTFPRAEYKYITQTETVVLEPKKWVIYANADYIHDMGLFISGGLSYTPGKQEFHVEYGWDVINNKKLIKAGLKVPLLSF